MCWQVYNLKWWESGAVVSFPVSWTYRSSWLHLSRQTMLQHDAPPYTPDLAMSDHFLRPTMTLPLSGRCTEEQDFITGLETRHNYWWEEQDLITGLENKTWLRNWKWYFEVRWRRSTTRTSERWSRDELNPTLCGFTHWEWNWHSYAKVHYFSTSCYIHVV